MSGAPDARALARVIDDGVERLLRVAADAEPEALARAPGDDAWSARHVLAHVAEFLPYWADQALAVATRERDREPFGRTHDDAERSSAIERHRGDELEELSTRLRDAAARAIATLERIPEDGWRRTGVHRRRGEMTVLAIVDQFVVDHLDEHAKQAEDAVAAG